MKYYVNERKLVTDTRLGVDMNIKGNYIIRRTGDFESIMEGRHLYLQVMDIYEH